MQLEPHRHLQSWSSACPSASAFARLFQFGLRRACAHTPLAAPGGRVLRGPLGTTTPSFAWRNSGALHRRLLPKARWSKGQGQPRPVSRRWADAKACYAGRVAGEEGFGASSRNPPRLVEFIRRDLRWCKATCSIGSSSGCRPQAGQPLPARIRDLMFIGSPAWVGMRSSPAGSVRGGRPRPPDFMRWDAECADSA